MKNIKGFALSSKSSLNFEITKSSCLKVFSEKQKPVFLIKYIKITKNEPIYIYLCKDLGYLATLCDMQC